MTWLALINGLTRLFNGLLDWWREKSIHDAGVNAERLRVMEAERMADEKMRKVDSVKPADRDDIIDRLKSGGF